MPDAFVPVSNRAFRSWHWGASLHHHFVSRLRRWREDAKQTGYELRVIVENGFAELVDGWVETLRSALEDEDADDDEDTDRTDLEDQLSKTAKLAGQVMRVARNADGARTHLGRQEPDLVFVMIQKLQERNGEGDEQEIVFAAENDEQLDAKGENLLPAKTDELRSGKLVAKIGERKAFPVLNESEDVLVLIDEAHPLAH